MNGVTGANGTSSTSGAVRGLRGWGRVALLASLWGSTFLWTDLALRGLSPLQVAFTRCVLGALVLVAACCVSGRRLPRGLTVWRHLTVAAFFCNALPFALFSVGQQTVSSGMAGVLNATTPLWSIALGLVLGSERGVRPARLAGLVLGFVGTVVLFAPWQSGTATGWGALAIVGAAASYAVAFTYMGRTLVGRGTPTVALSAAQLVAASGLTAAAVLPFGGAVVPVAPGAAVVAAAVVLGVCCTAATFHLTYRIINDEGATNAAVVGYLLPVVSVVLGVVVLGEQLNARVLVGMAVILLGVALTRRVAPQPPVTVAATATTVGPAARPAATPVVLAAAAPSPASPSDRGGAAERPSRRAPEPRSAAPAGGAPNRVASRPGCASGEPSDR